MRAGVLSAGILNIGTWVRPAVKEHKPLDEVRPRTSGWNEDAFARQQIGNLVRQAFFSAGNAVRHVVFSGVEFDSDVNEICCGVGQALASERPESVLVVVRDAIGQNGTDTTVGLVCEIAPTAWSATYGVWRFRPCRAEARWTSMDHERSWQRCGANSSIPWLPIARVVGCGGQAWQNLLMGWC